MKSERLNKEDKKELLRYAITILISLLVMWGVISISIASDKKCNENHTAEFCRQQ